MTFHPLPRGTLARDKGSALLLGRGGQTSGRGGRATAWGVACLGWRATGPRHEVGAAQAGLAGLPLSLPSGVRDAPELSYQENGVGSLLVPSHLSRHLFMGQKNLSPPANSFLKRNIRGLQTLAG